MSLLDAVLDRRVVLGWERLRAHFILLLWGLCIKISRNQDKDCVLVKYRTQQNYESGKQQEKQDQKVQRMLSKLN